MERLKQELQTLLSERFPGCQALLEVARPAAKVGGILVWAGFGASEPIDRQRAVWAFLREHLSRSDQLNISSLITLTPAEYETSREPVRV